MGYHDNYADYEKWYSSACDENCTCDGCLEEREQEEGEEDWREEEE